VKLVVATVGKSRAPWADDAVAEWTRRLRGWGGLDADVVKQEPFKGDVDAVRHAESDRLIARLGPRDRLVALDERGVDVTTEQFAKILIDARDQAVSRLVFAIGGAYGHHESLRARAHKVVRLSALVLNHEVARVVLVEQIYRATSLVDGSPYHHE
jgi:23S rRNA (pseudouridine1915-N3)-methyltransferase